MHIEPSNTPLVAKRALVLYVVKGFAYLWSCASPTSGVPRISSRRITPIDHTSYDSGRRAEYAVCCLSATLCSPGAYGYTRNGTKTKRDKEGKGKIRRVQIGKET